MEFWDKMERLWSWVNCGWLLKMEGPEWDEDLQQAPMIWISEKTTERGSQEWGFGSVEHELLWAEPDAELTLVLSLEWTAWLSRTWTVFLYDVNNSGVIRVNENAVLRQFVPLKKGCNYYRIYFMESGGEGSQLESQGFKLRRPYRCKPSSVEVSAKAFGRCHKAEYHLDVRKNC